MSARHKAACQRRCPDEIALAFGRIADDSVDNMPAWPLICCSSWVMALRVEGIDQQPAQAGVLRRIHVEHHFLHVGEIAGVAGSRSWVAPSCEENTRAFFRTCIHSAWRSTSQNPRPPGHSGRLCLYPDDSDRFRSAVSSAMGALCS